MPHLSQGGRTGKWRRAPCSPCFSHLLADNSKHKYWGGESRKCKSGLTRWFEWQVWWTFKGEIPDTTRYITLFQVASWNHSISPNGWLLAACCEVSLSLKNGTVGLDPWEASDCVNFVTLSTRCTEDIHVLLPGPSGAYFPLLLVYQNPAPSWRKGERVRFLPTTLAKVY